MAFFRRCRAVSGKLIPNFYRRRSLCGIACRQRCLSFGIVLALVFVLYLYVCINSQEIPVALGTSGLFEQYLQAIKDHARIHNVPFMTILRNSKGSQYGKRRALHGFRARAGIKYRMNSQQIETACIIPKIDPFGPDVIRYVETLDPVQCPGQKYGKVINGELHITAQNVRAAGMYSINRPVDEDEFAELGPRHELMKYERTRVEEGAFGCLGIKYDGEHYIVVREPPFEVEDDGLFLIKQPCTYDHVVQFKDHQLKYAAASWCLGLQDNSESLSAYENCGNVEESFRADALGRIYFGENWCLVVVKGENPKLGFGKKCARFYMLQALEIDFQRKVKLQSEFVQLVLYIEDKEHIEFHVQAYRNLTDRQRKEETHLVAQNDGPPFSVYMIMFDSQSAASFQRNLDETMALLNADSNTHIFHGQTIVGDGTLPQIAAMLTGKPLEELPDARQSFFDSVTVDKWPLLFKDYGQKGYVTLFSEDEPNVGVFNLRLRGFKDPPTTHYGRPFWLHTQSDLFITEPSCIQSEFSHNIGLEYLKSFITAYPRTPKFALVINSQLTHGKPNDLQYADSDLKTLLLTLNKTKELDRSIFILFGDHGMRAGEFRSTIQGKLEERLPFLSITLPKWIKENYPDLVINFRKNTNVVTTYYDVHATLRHLLELREVPKEIGTGQSLFTPLDPATRTCEEIGVDEHWCPCLEYKPMNTNKTDVVIAAIEAVRHINRLIKTTKLSTSLCSRLKLQRIISAGKTRTNKYVHMFNRTEDDSECDSCKPVFESEGNPVTNDVSMEIVFSVSPSQGIYEVTMHLRNGKPVVWGDISRLNMYGQEPSCIQAKYPHLRKYCYCKNYKPKSTPDTGQQKSEKQWPKSVNGVTNEESMSKDMPKGMAESLPIISSKNMSIDRSEDRSKDGSKSLAKGETVDMSKGMAKGMVKGMAKGMTEGLPNNIGKRKSKGMSKRKAEYMRNKRLKQKVKGLSKSMAEGRSMDRSKNISVYSSKETLTDKTRYMPEDVSVDMVKGTANGLPKRMSKQTSKGVSNKMSHRKSKAMPKSVSQHIANDMAKNKVKAISGDIRKTVSKGTSKVISDRMSKQKSKGVSNSMSRRKSKTMSKGVPQHKAHDMAKSNAKAISGGISKTISKGTAKGMSDRISKQKSEGLSKSMSKRKVKVVAKGVPQHMANDIAKSNVKALSKGMAKDMSEGMMKDISNRVSKKMPKSKNVILSKKQRRKEKKGRKRKDKRRTFKGAITNNSKSKLRMSKGKQ